MASWLLVRTHVDCREFSGIAGSMPEVDQITHIAL